MSTKAFFRILFILGCSIIAGLLIAGIFQPKDFVVSRTVIINASKDSVFSQMVHFKNWEHWSPWVKLDSTMKQTFDGVDGTEGSTYHWVGDERKTGEVIIKNVGTTADVLNFQFDLIKPSESSFKGALKAVDSAGVTKATFDFVTHFNYPFNAMVMFMNLDKTLSKDLVNALNNMKLYIEAKPTLVH